MTKPVRKLGDYMQQAAGCVRQVVFYTSPEAFDAPMVEPGGRVLLDLPDDGGAVMLGNEGHHEAVLQTARALMARDLKQDEADERRSVLGVAAEQTAEALEKLAGSGTMPENWTNATPEALGAFIRGAEPVVQRPGVAFLICGGPRVQPEPDSQPVERFWVLCVAVGGALNAFDCCADYRDRHGCVGTSIRQIEVDLPHVQFGKPLDPVPPADAVKMLLSGVPFTLDGGEQSWLSYRPDIGTAFFFCDRLQRGRWMEADLDDMPRLAIEAIELFMGSANGT